MMDVPTLVRPQTMHSYQPLSETTCESSYGECFTVDTSTRATDNDKKWEDKLRKQLQDMFNSL